MIVLLLALYIYREQKNKTIMHKITFEEKRILYYEKSQ